MLSEFRSIMIGGAIASLALLPCAAAAATDNDANAGSGDSTAAMHTKSQSLAGPMEDVQEAANVLEKLRQQAPELAAKVPDARGVFVIPDYATAALLIGGAGGEGVLMTRQNDQWGNPGFYDVGNIDIGAQAGAAAGPIVLLLMSDKAVDNFRSNTKFSLDAQAGLTIVNWSSNRTASTAAGDVIAWSDAKGLMAKASVGIGGIRWDQDANQKYYNQQVSAEQVLAGDVENPHENVLQSEFAQFSGQQPMKESGSMKQGADSDNDSDSDDY